MQGAASIRVYGFRQKLMEKWEKAHDLNKRVEVHSQYALLWIMLILDLSLVVMAIGCCLLIVVNKGYQ